MIICVVTVSATMVIFNAEKEITNQKYYFNTCHITYNNVLLSLA
jgi:hypothetical protein